MFLSQIKFVFQWPILQTLNGQSEKVSTIVIYESRVISMRNLLVITIVESQFMLVEAS